MKVVGTQRRNAQTASGHARFSNRVAVKTRFRAPLELNAEEWRDLSVEMGTSRKSERPDDSKKDHHAVNNRLEKLRLHRSRRKTPGGKPPGVPSFKPRSAVYGQKLRCTRTRPDTTPSSAGEYWPAARLPPPPKLNTTSAGFMF